MSQVSNTFTTDLAIRVLHKLSAKLDNQRRAGYETDGRDYAIAIDCLDAMMSYCKVSAECRRDWRKAKRLCECANYKPQKRDAAMTALRAALRYC